MATFHSTKKKYPNQWADGKVYFNTLNVRAQEVIHDNPNSLFPLFNLTEFYSEKQFQYFSGESSYVWTKCHIDAKAVESIIKQCLPCVEHYALITHDRDKKDGKLKDKHTHLLIKFFRNQRVASRLVDTLHIDTWEDCLYKLGHCVSYLIHDSDDCRKQGKFQYAWEDVVTDDLSYWQDWIDNEVVKTDNTLDILDDLNSEMSYRDLVSKYGRDLVINYDKYKTFAQRMYNQENGVVRPIYVEHVKDGYVAYYDSKTGELLKVKRFKDDKTFNESVDKLTMGVLSSEQKEID